MGDLENLRESKRHSVKDNLEDTIHLRFTKCLWHWKMF